MKRFLLILVSTLIAVPFLLYAGLSGYAYMNDWLTDYEEPIICKMEEHEIHLPRGYLRFGPAVLGCHPAEGNLLFDAYQPDVRINPAELVSGMLIKEYSPRTVSISVHTGKHSKGRTQITPEKYREIFESKKASLLPVGGYEALFEVPEEDVTHKGGRQFYHISPSGKTHFLFCYKSGSQKDYTCGGSQFSPIEGLRASYQYRNPTLIPNLEISEQVEELLNDIIKK